jgi:hypothetical protein
MEGVLDMLCLCIFYCIFILTPRLTGTIFVCLCITPIVHFILLLQIAGSFIRLTVVEVSFENGSSWCCNVTACAFLRPFLDRCF